jgi:hypothetical protein
MLYHAVDKMAWDCDLPAIMLGYNCSRQASTELSPCQLMDGATPMLPAQLTEHFNVVVDPTQEQAATVYWQRAQRVAEYGWATWLDLLTAQHRDQLWYAKVRSGDHLAAAQQLAPGMLVYLKTQQPTILQVVWDGPLGVDSHCKAVVATSPGAMLHTWHLLISLTSALSSTGTCRWHQRSSVVSAVAALSVRMSCCCVMPVTAGTRISALTHF